MSLPRWAGNLKRNLFRRQDVEVQLDVELGAYVDLLTQEKQRAGLGPREARRAALLETGGVELVKEQVRDARTGAWIGGVWQDVRFALRGLRKSPGFTAVAVLSLALGIGANSAIFGVFYAAFLRPLPYPHAERLYALNRTGFGVLTPELIVWRAGARALRGVAGWDDSGVTITGVGTPERLDAATVSANFLSVLGVQPMLGRGFTEADGRPGMTATAILMYDLWQRKFGGDAGMAGRIVLLDGKPTAILGVMPPDFRFPGSYRPDLLTIRPLPVQPDWTLDTFEGFNVIGRLRDGVTPEQARGDLAALSSGEQMVRFLEKIIGIAENGRGVNSRIELKPLQEQINGRSRPVLGLLLAAVCLLLLIACVNVASLQLGRASARCREIGLRAALGASRLRLARLLAIENLALAVLAGAAGLLVASGLLSLLRRSEGLPIAGLRDLNPGWMLGGAALALSAFGGLLMGLAPAFFAPRLELNQVLKSGAVGVMGGQKSWVRPALVVTQVALALVLLLGSGLLIRSLAGVLAVDPGFRPAKVLTARLQLSNSRYRSEAQQRAFVQELLDRLSGLPGVESVAATNTIPLTNPSLGGIVRLEGEPPRQHGKPTRSSGILIVTPQYFRAMGMRLLRGNLFSGGERGDGPPVVVVNALTARAFFGTEEVVGMRVQALNLGDDKPWWTIIGVVNDVHMQGPESQAETQLFVPESQWISRRVHVVIRTRGDPLAVAQGLRATVWSLDKDMPVAGMATMEEMLSRRGAGRRAQTLLLSAFAFLAMCLAAIGIYGVVSEAVNRRTREIGLRMALGARAGDVLRMVMRRSLVLALIGIVAGTAAGAWLMRYLTSQLFGVKANDPATFAVVALALLVVALVAGYLPARRAVRIDPVAALRCE